MSVQRLGRDTISVDSLIWNGRGFGNEEADSMWLQLSSSLKKIALAELSAGNIPEHILRNETRNIVLLSFKAGPITPPPNPNHIRVHSQHKTGNYCYEGTLCTYEDNEAGCFLAFNNPDHVYAF